MADPVHVEPVSFEPYSERLSAPLGMWLAVYGVTLGVIPIVLVVLRPAGVVAVTLAAYALVTFALRRWEPTVAVTGGELRAGPAHIPARLLGEPVALGPAAAARARGPEYDPRAYHLIRGWIPAAVAVPVLDPADPTTAWYVATRRPEQLAAAIRGARMRATDAA